LLHETLGKASRSFVSTHPMGLLQVASCDSSSPSMTFNDPACYRRRRGGELYYWRRFRQCCGGILHAWESPFTDVPGRRLVAGLIAFSIPLIPLRSRRFSIHPSASSNHSHHHRSFILAHAITCSQPSSTLCRIKRRRCAPWC
jgi:hypothetical protein